MNDLTEVNKLAADKCGVGICHNIYDALDTDLYIANTNGSKVWSIERAECREIFRNWWINQKSGRSVVFMASMILYADPMGGVARSDEKACIIAILESER